MNKQTKVTDEIKERARTLREGGASYGEIGKELGISPSTAHKLVSPNVSDEKEEAPKAQFLDVEGRFLALLQRYGIKDPERIVDYLSSVSENSYTDLEGLRRGLGEQGVPSGKQLPIVRHWGAQEKLPIPERLLAESESTAITTSKEGKQRYSVMGMQICLDPAGPYDNVIDAQRELGLRLQQTQQSGGDNEVKELRQSFEALRAEMANRESAALREQIQSVKEGFQNQIKVLTDAIGAKTTEESKFGVMSKGLEGVLGEIKGIRGDAKPVVEMFLMRGMPPPARRSKEEIARFASGLSKGIRKAELAQKQAAALAGGEPLSQAEEEELQELNRISAAFIEKQAPAPAPLPPPLPPIPRTFE